MLLTQTSPEELYHDFARNAAKTQTDVREFTEFVRNDRSRDVFEKAAESRAQNSEDIRGWRVTEHEDWLDVRGVDAPKDVKGDDMTGTDWIPPPQNGIEDLRAAMERFKKNHPGIDCTLDEHLKAMKITLPPPSAIHFSSPQACTQPFFAI
ncbi:MAG: hypothetical protein Q9168_001462 [Polycauliona sp. 1 TL-2023]